MRPVQRGTPPQQNGQPIQFTKYQDARGALIDRLGEYCSYCEMHLDASLAVEHVQPKKHHPDAELRWGNFLLGCTNCNSTKGQQDVELEDVFWPDRDNTFLALTYEAGGRVSPAAMLAGEQALRAAALLKLVGLDKEPKDGPSVSDRRWNNRREAWEIAQMAWQDLADSPSPAMKRIIVELAKAKGYWSVWMTVFSNDQEMRTRLLTPNAFPGTAIDCFDVQTQALPRPNGLI